MNRTSHDDCSQLADKEDIIVKRKNRPLKKRSRVRNGKKWAMVLAVGVVLLLMGVGTARAIQATQAGGLPPAKPSLQALVQQQIATARAYPPRPKPKTPQVPSPQPAPKPQAGIVNTHQGPFAGMLFAVENLWQGPVGSNWELVYAGAEKNPDGSLGPGALKLYTEAPDSDGGFDIHSIGTYPAPNGVSDLIIVAVNGNLMQLRTDTGGTLVFNLQTNQYS